MTTIESAAFAENKLTEITLPPIKMIKEDTFAWNQLTNITIPSSVTSIGRNAFGFNHLTSLNFGYLLSSLRNIGDRAFQNNRLTDVTIPWAVINIGTKAFDDGVNVYRE